MPRKTYKKKMPNRRKPKPKYVVIKPRIPLNGVKNSEIAKLRYVEQINIAQSSGDEVYNFRANSLFDPNLTGTGHQPMGFDQLALKYDHYQVLGSVIRITPIITGTSTSSGDAPSWVIVRTVDNSTTDYTNFRDVLENQPYGRQKKLYISNYAPWGDSPALRTQKIISAYYDPKKMFGLNKSTLRANEDLKPLVTANPNEDAIFQIQAFPVGTNGTRDGIDLLVEIDYTAVFTEPRSLPSS